MTDKNDDLEAVRTLVTTLEQFDKEEQERIIRWATEKLGLEVRTTIQPVVQTPPLATDKEIMPKTGEMGTSRDIKTFVNVKKPTTDSQFATTVAYYLRFEAPEVERQDTITSKDLLDACRKVGRTRMRFPAQTLLNAHHDGLLDKTSDRGAYAINTVGENLVAMTLPGSATASQSTQNKTKARNKSQKKAAKKLSSKKSKKG